jgi:hypothetical protein
MVAMADGKGNCIKSAGSFDAHRVSIVPHAVAGYHVAQAASSSA